MSEIPIGSDMESVVSAGSQREARIAHWRSLLPWTSYWIVMAASFALTAWLADDKRLGDYAWYAMAQGNVLLIVALELLIPRDPSVSLFKDRQSWNDIGHMLLFKLACRPLAWAIVLAMVGFAASKLGPFEGVWPAQWPLAIQFVALLLVFDLGGYTYHRLLHRFDRLYVFHALHHDTRRFHVLKSNRLHVGEEMVNFLLFVPILITIGCPASVVTWLGMWEVFEGNLAHSNVDQRFPRWMHYVVRTQGVHYIHHSTDDRQQNSNFGGLPIWDILFGTYKHPFEHKVGATGIEGDPVPRGFLAQLIFPIRAQFRLPAPARNAPANEPAT